MPITILDGIVIGVALFSAVLAMVRGFSREVLSVASWVGAAAAAYFLYPVLLPYAKDYTTSDTVAMVGSAAAVFLVALIVISFITMRIADFIIDSRVGALDRTLGFLFGAARGILLVVDAMLFFNWLVAPQQQPAWARPSSISSTCFARSTTRPHPTAISAGNCPNSPGSGPTGSTTCAPPPACEPSSNIFRFPPGSPEPS